MAKYGSSSFAFFLANGYDLMASKLQGLTWKKEPITEMAHGLGDTAELPTPVGVSKYTLTQSGGFFDSAANGAHGLLAAGATAASRVVCFAVAGNSVGAPFVGCLGALTVGYEVIPQDGALTKANADYQITGEAYDGQIVQPWDTKTGDWNTDTLNTVVDYSTDPSQVVILITSASKAATCTIVCPVAHGLVTGQVILISGNDLSGPSVNGEFTVTVGVDSTTFTIPLNTSGSSGAGTGGSFVKCSTVNGGYGFQQVSALSGFTGFVGKIQDSADNVTYADLVTFTNVTAPYAAEAVSAAGTVDRYLAFDGNVTGSGSITMMSGFARG
jgi:hypothetical protein